MPLTETQIRNLKPASTPKKHFDGEGLFLYPLFLPFLLNGGKLVLHGDLTFL